jgi:biotin transporter BioY
MILTYAYWGLVATLVVVLAVWMLWPVISKSRPRQQGTDANAIDAALATLAPFVSAETIKSVAVEVSVSRWGPTVTEDGKDDPCK